MPRKKKQKKDDVQDREWIITQALLQGWKVYHKVDTYNHAIQITEKTFSVKVDNSGGVMNLSDTIAVLEQYDHLNNWTWDEKQTSQVVSKPSVQVITLELGEGKKRGGRR